MEIDENHLDKLPIKLTANAQQFRDMIEVFLFTDTCLDDVRQYLEQPNVDAYEGTKHLRNMINCANSVKEFLLANGADIDKVKNELENEGVNGRGLLNINLLK